jgi:hypothetical protein
MYTEDLKEATLSIDQIFLDPNNPRFWSEKTGRDVPDKKIPEPNHQSTALKEISEFGVEELLTSILRNGFLPLDRIVVRAIKDYEDKYVAVEGNRRLAALITLRQRIADGMIEEEGFDEEKLSALKTSTDKIQVLVYSGSEGADVAWMLQGIRHLSGIREWSPAQQGKLVADQIDRLGMNFREAGQSLGLSATAVGKRFRAYKALEQMRKDEEFRGKAENKYYSLFEEALGSQSVKNWLGWNDQDFNFKNTNNLHQFYNWITPDDQHENKRRLHDPRHIKKLGLLIAGKHTALMEQVDSHALGIEAASEKAKETGPSHDWKKNIESAIVLLKEIPHAAITDHADDIVGALAPIETLLLSMKETATNTLAKQEPRI